MSSDEDEAELKEMRSMARMRRVVNVGPDLNGKGRSSQADLDALRQKQQRMKEEENRSERFFSQPPAAQGDNSKTDPPSGKNVGDATKEGVDNNDDEEEDGLPIPAPEIEEEPDFLDGLRASFPVAFGRQEAKVAPLENVHAQTKRGVQKSKKGKSGIAIKIGGSLEKRIQQGITEPNNSNDAEASIARVDNDRGNIRKEGGEEASVARGLVGPRRPPSNSSKDVHDNREGDSTGAKEEAGEDFVGPARHQPSQSPGDVAGKGRETLLIGPPRPGGQIRKMEKAKGGMGRREAKADEESEDESEEESEEESEDEEEGDEFGVPLSNEIVLGGHTRAVSALAVDPTGTRVLSGSYDYSIRFFDFQGMDSRLQSFRQITPFDGHQVRDITFSPTADLFMVATGSAQAKVYNRDGKTQGEFVRGDMYIRDLRHTSGHISGLTAASWHPVERHTAMTSSDDGSVRIWDVRDFKTQKKVVKPKLARPGRVPVTACCWGPDGRMIAAGLQDGSVQAWHVKSGWGSLPDLLNAKAHEQGEDVTGVSFSSDGSMLLSRCTDGTLKVWDVRKFKEPLKVFSDLPNHYGQTNVTWSPDERLFLTGTSTEKGGRGGQIHFFSKESLELVRVVGVSEHQSVVKVLWHQRLNQVFATTGDKKEGGTHVLYDPKLSERGALVCVARAPRQARPEDMCSGVLAPAIHNPHALPMFRDEPSRKRQREKARKDPVASKRPDLPMDGQGHGGRVGQAKGSLLTQYLLREAGMIKETWMEEDPREAILKYAEAAEKDPQIIAPAYAQTQPKTIFHESDEEEED